MLSATYTGCNDTIQIKTGETTVTASYYELTQYLDRLSGAIPPPCPDCEGRGDVVVEERDLVVCGTCKGSRVS